jgi:DNA ligase-1
MGGKGKYQGMMGALLLEAPNGLRFKVGTGFSDKDRAQPPEIGSTVTYQFSGRTNSGLPRFPRFLRRRNDL